MKTIKSLLCVAACTVGFVGSVNAATIAIGNDTTSAGARNRSVPLELQDDDLSEYTKVEFRLSVSGTSYASISFDYKTSAGMNLMPEGDKYIITRDEGLQAITLGNINYTTTENLSSDFKIVLNDVKFYKKDTGAEMHPGDAGIKKVDGTIKYERPKSTEATLTNLTTSQGTLTPSFDKNITEYAIQVKDTINYIRLSATPCAGAKVQGDGSKALEQGENLFEIVVTAEDGATTNTYTVRVIRGEIAEPSAYLKSLDLNNIGVELSPKFDSKNNKYTVNITKDISKLNFKYELEYPLAEVSIEGNEDFQEGENLVTIKVTAEGVDEQLYEITVIKESEESTEPIVDPEKPEEKPEKKTNVWLIASIVIVILAIVGGVIFVLFKKKKKNNKKDDPKLPLKRRQGSEKTVEIDRIREDESPRHAALDDDEQESATDEASYDERGSVTEILKTELYEDDRTQRFDSDEFEDLKKKLYEEEDVDQTKEFNFKDFE